MSWLSGIFTRTNGTYTGATVWNQDRLAGTKITSANHDTHDQDIATGINACINKNGENSPSANVDWGGFKITNLGVATTDTGAVNRSQLKHFYAVQVIDEDTVLTTGIKLTIRFPFDTVLTDVRASISTAQTSGSILTFDVNKSNGSTILNPKITIDNGEKTSVTAAILPGIETTTFASDAFVTIDIEQVGDGTAKGLRITFICLFS